MLSITNSNIESWRVVRREFSVATPAFLDEALAGLRAAETSVLTLGAGRSDVCLNSGSLLLRTAMLGRIVAADWTAGIIRAEAGITLDALLNVAVPRGWFLPVTPGTKFVTLGGAVANDVHGKNHETAGTIGCHIRRIGLARSSGEILELSEAENPERFRPTIGGLGLTGLILWVENALKQIGSSDIEVETLELVRPRPIFDNVQNLSQCAGRPATSSR